MKKEDGGAGDLLSGRSGRRDSGRARACGRVKKKGVFYQPLGQNRGGANDLVLRKKLKPESSPRTFAGGPAAGGSSGGEGFRR